ncbi:MAG: hypothetical protein IH984_14450 [Planctomycetes bacterium]|nr:hypothetical protein [Planctomycetota bacterium]
MSTVTARDISMPREMIAEDLRDLMRSVNDTTQRLEQTHVVLRSEVAQLQRELADANAQLRRSRALAALGEMAAGIAHEIRNPLASIQLYVQMLGEDVAEQPEQAKLCKKIANAVEGLDAIVRDVLLFARDTKIRPCFISTKAMFDRAIEPCTSLLRDERIKLLCDGLNDSDFQLYADETLFVLALSNVIRNAAEAMLEAEVDEGEIELSVSRRHDRLSNGNKEEMAVFCIEDTGPGIDPDVVKRMFNPFFTTRKTGTGLGLAIVHRIVDAHGGRVTVTNRPQRGAKVELVLPLGAIESVDLKPTHDQMCI